MLKLKLPAEIGPESQFVMAFSGGLDSSVLLHLLAHDNNFRSRIRSVLHVNHQLHPDADTWAQHCAQFCAALNLPFEAIKVDVKRNDGNGLEAAARAARYSAFDQRLKTNEVLVAAHHRDDQVETVFLKLLRGAGEAGLAGMRTLRVHNSGLLWRPLLETSRASLLDYANAHQITWIDDPSNLSSHHDRNFLRHEILPKIRTRWPAADNAVAHSAQLLAHRSIRNHEQTRQALANARTIDPHVLLLDHLREMHEFELGDVIRAWCDELKFNYPNHQIIARIQPELINASEDAQPLLEWPGAQLHRYRNQLVLHAPMQVGACSWQAALFVDQKLELPNQQGSLLISTKTESQAGLNPYQIDPLQQAFQACVETGFTVRFRVGGESISLAENRPSQYLKNLLQASGIPPWQRDCIPLIFCQQNLVAVGDYFVDSSWKKWLTQHALRLQWQRH